MKDKISKMKEKLNQEIKLKGLKHKDVLKLSRELDELINKYEKIRNVMKSNNYS